MWATTTWNSLACSLIVVLLVQGGNNDVVTSVAALAFSFQYKQRRAVIRPSRFEIGSSVTIIDRSTLTFNKSRTPTYNSRRRIAARLSLYGKTDGDDDDEEMGPGMKDAFRQLDALESIGDDDDDEKKKSKIPPSKKPIQADKIKTPPADKASPEKEVQVYSEMVKELEEQDDDDLYSDVLADMGGDPSKASAQKAKSKSKSSDDSSSSSDDDDNVPSSLLSSTTLETDTETFMNQALEEAIREASKESSSSSSSSTGGGKVSDSILNDKEIMKEIEAIFERGNDKLLESLEEIRAEQSELAKASAEDSAQSAMDNMDGNAQRLAMAESAMVSMLEKVNKETAEVEKAVQDLKQAQMDMESDSDRAVDNLRKGGLPKQAALVGLLLFSFRSIVDSISAMGGSGDMTAALIQGAIALACGAYLILF